MAMDGQMKGMIYHSIQLNGLTEMVMVLVIIKKKTQQCQMSSLQMEHSGTILTEMDTVTIHMEPKAIGSQMTQLVGKIVIVMA